MRPPEFDKYFLFRAIGPARDPEERLFRRRHDAGLASMAPLDTPCELGFRLGAYAALALSSILIATVAYLVCSSVWVRSDILAGLAAWAVGVYLAGVLIVLLLGPARQRVESYLAWLKVRHRRGGRTDRLVAPALSVGVSRGVESDPVADYDGHVAAHEPAQQPDAGPAQHWDLHWDPRGWFTARMQATDDVCGVGGPAGLAPTPVAARELVEWWAGTCPREVTFRTADGTAVAGLPPRPPVLPNPLNDTDIFDAPLATARDALEDMAQDTEAPAHRQLTEACQRRRGELDSVEDIDGWLAHAAERLNRTAPQPPHAPVNGHRLGGADQPCREMWAAEWVPTGLVVSTPNPVWNEFDDHRPEMPRWIVSGLLDEATGAAGFVTELFGGPDDPVNLVRQPAWAGPIYQLGSNGNHRVHTVRMLDLPWTLATVSLAVVEAVVTVEDTLGPVEDRGHTDTAGQRLALWRGLLSREVIRGEIDQGGAAGDATLSWTRLPAGWLLLDPTTATAWNAVYESCYPGALARIGIPAEVGTDARRWTTWLTG